MTIGVIDTGGHIWHRCDNDVGGQFAASVNDTALMHLELKKSSKIFEISKLRTELPRNSEQKA